ncbi:HNH endonuclease [Kitasatospora sp. MY 5-36]|uniref:HNH endonuclease n=1 Tax=unclassified Kitasatospora TaxID=2633591 RepID=UPI0006712EBB|nr:HNH endonuclease [Kitasatospora sp. MY 5-36]
MTSPKKPRRNYSSGTVAGLLTLARGGCYWPECKEPTVRMVEGDPIQNLQIAHIRALEDNGPRAEPTWSEAERNHFSNLILLCTVHHKVIDGPRSGAFSVELLLDWKKAREADGVDALEGLGDLTKADLGELIREAQAEFAERLGPALDEFAKSAPELASVLKLATSEFAELRNHRGGVSEDTAMLLQDAARSLRGLEDNANTLSRAARDLKGLEDSACTLADAADGLKGLEGNAAALAAAAQRLRGLESIASMLASAANKLGNLEGQSWELKEASQEIKEAAREVLRATEALNEARRRNR